MINIFAKKITEDDYKVIERIKGFLDKNLKEKIDIKVIDVMTEEYPVLEDYSIICGPIDPFIEEGSEIKTVRVSSLQNLKVKENNKKAAEAFKELVDSINNNINNDPKNKQINYIEKSGVTIGKELTDIMVTDEEVEYLKKIKSLLDGSKIVISKGDLRLEIE